MNGVKQIRLAILVISLFILGDLLVSSHSRRSFLAGWSHANNSLRPITNTPIRTEWTEDTFPETVVALHKIPGWTVFQNLFIFDGTIFIVTRTPELVPETKFITSNGLKLELEQQNLPTANTLKVVTPEEAIGLFGISAALLEGVSFVQTDASQFIHHYYHMIVEIFALGHWRTFTSPDLDHIYSGSDRPFPKRFFFPNVQKEEWIDRAGMNMWTLRAGIPGLSLEFKDDWDYRMSMRRPFLLETVVLGDRAAWHRGPFWKLPTTVFPLVVRDDWWEPIRKSVVAFTALRPNSIKRVKPVITYISRQKTGRRLRDDDHAALVQELRTMGREHGYEIQIPLMEDLEKSEQVALLARTTVLLGVHGNGLSGQIWLEPTPRTTVIEIFFPGGFAYDYEYTARSRGVTYYGFWEDEHFTAPDLPPIASPKGFHESNIPCNATAISSLIHRRLTLKDPSLA